jgi:hypothetical protein
MIKGKLRFDRITLVTCNSILIPRSRHLSLSSVIEALKDAYIGLKVLHIFKVYQSVCKGVDKFAMHFLQGEYAP